MVASLIFSKSCQECSLFVRYFLTSQLSGIFLLISAIYAKGNKAKANSSHTQLWLTINGLLKTLLRYFGCFHFPNFRIIFVKTFIKKVPFLSLPTLCIPASFIKMKSNFLFSHFFRHCPWNDP